MNTILNYLTENGKYTLTLIITFIICFFIITLIPFFYKKSKQNISNDCHEQAINNKICNDLSINAPQSAIINQNVVKNSATLDTSTPLKGEWIIFANGNKFHAELKIGETTLLKTEIFTSLSGLKSGIDTLNKNIQAENFAITLNSNGEFIFKVFSTAKRILCLSDGYKSLEDCENTFKQIKEVIQNNPIIINN